MNYLILNELRATLTFTNSFGDVWNIFQFKLQNDSVDAGFNFQHFQSNFY